VGLQFRDFSAISFVLCIQSIENSLTVINWSKSLQYVHTRTCWSLQYARVPADHFNTYARVPADHFNAYDRVPADYSRALPKQWSAQIRSCWPETAVVSSKPRPAGNKEVHFLVVYFPLIYISNAYYATYVGTPATLNINSQQLTREFEPTILCS
jgi:hypothetical protein